MQHKIGYLRHPSPSKCPEFCTDRSLRLISVSSCWSPQTVAVSFLTWYSCAGFSPKGPRVYDRTQVMRSVRECDATYCFPTNCSLSLHVSCMLIPVGGCHIVSLLTEEVWLEVLTAVSMKMAVFWVVAPCRLVSVYQRFRCRYCLHHQGGESLHWWWRQHRPL
jgi:hypothetical protein